MPDELSFSDFRPYDVLLFHGSNPISRLIRIFDGSDFNHSAVFLGGELIAEASWPELRTITLPDRTKPGEYVMVRRLNPPADTMDPIGQATGRYLADGGRYAYEALLLLAALSISRRVPMPRMFKTLLRQLLDAAASLINELIVGGRQPMICSEFVYRCYDEALPDEFDKYSIDIDRTRKAVRLSSIGLEGVADPRGRGIDPGSILASVGNRVVTRLEAMEATPELPELPKPDPEALNAELEPLMVEYERELRAGTGFKRADEVAADPEIRAALERLVLTSTATIEVPRIESLEAEREVDIRYSLFSRTIADFVTPADLRRSGSLADIGRWNRR